MKKGFILSAAIGIACVIFIASKNNKKENSENEANEEEGYDYFFAQRSYPNNKIDYDAYQHAAQLSKNQVANMRTTSTASWQYAGPNNIGGRIVDI
ncbi:MAG: hypothetical protein ABI855_06255, partial [Bacteroidota bacterium]